MQQSSNMGYPEEPGKDKIESCRNKLIICAVMFVIGLIGEMACFSVATAMQLVWYGMAAVGFYGGIGFAIALHSAKKHYNEAMEAYKNECAEIDKENDKKRIADLHRELAVCRSRITELRTELDHDKESRESTDGFSELFSTLGSINGEFPKNSLDASIAKKQNELDALISRENDLRKQLESLGNP